MEEEEEVEEELVLLLVEPLPPADTQAQATPREPAGQWERRGSAARQRLAAAQPSGGGRLRQVSKTSQLNAPSVSWHS